MINPGDRVTDLSVPEGDNDLSLARHPDKPGVVLVRARVPGVIEPMLPDVEVCETGLDDWPNLAEVGADELAQALATFCLKSVIEIT